MTDTERARELCEAVWAVTTRGHWEYQGSQWIEDEAAKLVAAAFATVREDAFEEGATFRNGELLKAAERIEQAEAERDRLRVALEQGESVIAEADAIRDERRRLRAALAQVEWHDAVCPWCGNVKPGAINLVPMKPCQYGHAPDCPRQAALKGQP